jgi:murein DD-endopeptidase MepM/ murein hydrolase activator NlpD
MNTDERKESGKDGIPRIPFSPKDALGAVVSALRRCPEFLRRPWLKWSAVFTLLLAAAAGAASTLPAVRAWWSSAWSADGSPAAAGEAPADELTGLLPQIPRPKVEPFVSRAIVAANPTQSAETRRDVITYTVQSGDFLFAIAERFGLQPETILWSNYSVLKDNPDLLRPGQVLFILPVDGLYYQWQAGDRLDRVAESYGVTPEDIVLWPGNYLDPDVDLQNPEIAPGTWLVIPSGYRAFQLWEIPVIRRTDGTPWVAGGEGACQGPFSGPAGTGMWTWPTASHWVCGNEYTSYHHGIDLYITMDEPIRSADRGVVVYAGWNTWGYGNLVVVDHGNDWQTVYAHLDAVSVYCGATVNRGETIGLGGSTGNSTGPHLHFEMIFSGLRVNPHDYLP